MTEPIEQLRYVEYVDLDALKPAPHNPKEHDDDTIDASLDRFGYVEPIALDERTGCLVVGHGRLDRLRAKHAAGEEPPAGIVAYGTVWLVPIWRGWHSADDLEAEAYLIASNTIGPRGGWDDESLDESLARLEASDAGFVGIGIEIAPSQLPELPPAPAEAPFAGFPDQNRPDTVDFRFGDYAGKIGRAVYDAFVVAVEAERGESDAVLLDDVLVALLDLA